MSISSISTPAPVVPPAVNPPVVSAPQTPDAGDTQATRATVPAPLPPGQGTRVDQIV
jgi:hypothetical protein